MKSPCIGGAFEHQQKNNETCDNCPDRLKYNVAVGNLPREVLPKEVEEEYRERLLTVSEAEMAIDMADLKADESSKKKRGPKPKKEDNKMAQKQEELETLQSSAIQLILEHIRDKKQVGDEVDYALRALAAVGRIKATDRAKDATQFMVLREITKDKKEFQKYVEISLPHLNPRKQIEVE